MAGVSVAMICWYCYWGWPKQLADIYDAGEAAAGESAMDYGPAHVVWADENWDSVEDCLREFDVWVRDWNAGRYTSEQLEVVRQSLLALQALPADVLEAEPADYDGEHPDRYPPAAHLIMVRR